MKARLLFLLFCATVLVLLPSTLALAADPPAYEYLAEDPEI